MPLNRLLLLLLLSIDALLLYTLPGSSISDNNQPENQRANYLVDVIKQVSIPSIYFGHCSLTVLCRKTRISF